MQEPKTKVLYFDLETTGTDPRKHGIHQIGAIAEIDGTVVDVLELKVQPIHGDKIEEEALKVAGVTNDDLVGYMPAKDGKRKLERWLERFVRKFDPDDKFTLAGYNIRPFDIPFLRAWFKKQDDRYFGSWFNNQPLDVLGLVYWKVYLGSIPKLDNYKLGTLCKFAGIDLGEKAHDAIADIHATRELAHFIVGRPSKTLPGIWESPSLHDKPDRH